MKLAQCSSEIIQKRMPGCSSRLWCANRELGQFLTSWLRASKDNAFLERRKHVALQVVTDAASQTSLFVKVFYLRGIFDGIEHFFGDSRALRSARGNAILLRNGFAAQPSLGIVERRCFGVVTCSVLATEYLPEDKSLRAILKECADSQQRLQYVDVFAREIAALHARGIFHGDLQTDNVLLSDTRIMFIDNERTTQQRWFPTNYRVRNLRQWTSAYSGFSKTEKQNFITRYLHHANLSQSKARRIEQQVCQKRANVQVLCIHIPDRMSIEKCFCTAVDAVLRVFSSLSSLFSMQSQVVDAGFWIPKANAYQEISTRRTRILN